MPARFASGSRAVITAALEETRRRGDRRMGTEHLLLGLLHDRGGVPVQAIGVDLEAGRAALEALDQAALAALGIDVAGIELGSVPASPKRTPWTSAARSVLMRAVQEVKPEGRRRIAPEHLLLALLACERPDPAAELIEHLGLDRAAIRDRIHRPEASEEIRDEQENQ